MGIIVPILLLIASYFLGSIPWALIVSKIFKGIDIRDYGSKNMGATNVLRVLGFKYGIVVFILDACKAGFIISLFTCGLLDYQAKWMVIQIHPLIYGLIAVLGHMFPVFANFKGGKGVACCAGIILAYNPFLFLIIFASFILVLIISKYVSLGSIIASIVALICSFFFKTNGSFDWVLICTITICAAFIIIRHRSNIKRIINKTENKFEFNPKEFEFLRPRKKKNR